MMKTGISLMCMNAPKLVKSNRRLRLVHNMSQWPATQCDITSPPFWKHISDVENCTISPFVIQNRNNFYSSRRAAMWPKMTSWQSKKVASLVLATYCEPAFNWVLTHFILVQAGLIHHCASVQQLERDIWSAFVVQSMTCRLEWPCTSVELLPNPLEALQSISTAGPPVRKSL